MFVGPNIVTDGLVLSLDFASHKTYPGSGTTAYDLSGGECNLTFNNSPSFNNSNNGVLQFDGSDEYLEATTNVPILGGNPRTMIAMFNATTSTYGCMFGFGKNPDGVGGSYKSFELWNYHSASGLRVHLTGYNMAPGSNYVLANNTNKWIMTSLHYSNSNLTFRIIDNGTIYTGTGTPTIDTQTNCIRINKSAYGNEAGGMIGKFAAFYTYNRDLSEEEVLQNYNATKSRFGL